MIARKNFTILPSNTIIFYIFTLYITLEISFFLGLFLRVIYLDTCIFYLVLKNLYTQIISNIEFKINQTHKIFFHLLI